jgi:hypothetical protein
MPNDVSEAAFTQFAILSRAQAAAAGALRRGG